MDALLLFVHIAEIIIVAAVVSALLRKLKQPTLLAYIIAGVLIGPLVIGGVDWTAFGIPFPIGISSITPEVTTLSEIGMALLMFSIGIETSIHRLLKMGRSVILATLLQIGLVIFFTFLLTIPTGLLTTEQALFVGAILAFSSTMIVVKLLSDSNELNSLNSRLMISILLLQDFLMIFFVPMLSNVSNILDVSILFKVVSNSLLLFIIAFVMSRFVLPRFFRVAVEEQELFVLTSVATAFIFIGLSVLLDIPSSIGAFIGGLALSTLPYNLEIFSKIRALRDFFLTIFFVTLGAQLSFGFSVLNPWLMAVIILLVFVIKPIVFFVLSLFIGYGSKTVVKMGLSLFQVSEFGFVLVGIATATFISGVPIFSADLASFIITVIAISMIVSPYLMGSSSKVGQFFYNKAKHLQRHLRTGFFRRKLDELEVMPSKKELENHIIIVGGGTVGRGLAKELRKNNQVLVIDHDPDVVEQGQREGLPFVYGTSENETLFDKLDLPDAKLFIISILNHSESINMIKQVRKFNRKLPIFTIAHYFSDALDFYKQGAEYVCMPSVIGANSFMQKISEFIDTGKNAKVNKFKTEFMDYLEEKVKEEKKYRQRG
ncbi:Calcium-gated potassium channel MthK [uncultured archaeon]|nr:Calcium-gated potassium channel MthK [uncultured archaeon]